MSEELRFAVVLNGGVSLAVWMGGVAHELDQLTRLGGAYGGLLRELGLSARVDVIAGTSAGGINGAALALSQVNQKADLSTLRDLWAEQGRMETLLQKPFVGKPSSLLQGDAYFLPRLHEAMYRLTRPWQEYDFDERPIDLTITTTLLSGAQSVTTDSVGQVLPQERHDGQFRFFRGVNESEVRTDHFAKPKVIAEAMALAARCSAGFPIAFEPSFVPVNAPKPRGGAGRGPSYRPDMAAYANWSTFGPAAQAGEDHSRFTVDGGVLANTPTRQALEAIQRMKAGRRVQRVMLLVYPHAPEAEDADTPDVLGTAPTATTTLTRILTTLTGEGSRTFVNEVEQHNQRASTRRGTRTDILVTVGSDPGRLHERAACLDEMYRMLRLRRAARDLAARIEVPTDMSFDRVREAAEHAQRRWQRNYKRLPYVPDDLAANTTRMRQGHWDWGTTPALDIADIALELVEAVETAAPGQLENVDRARARIHAAMSDMRAVRDRIDSAWRDDPVLAQREPDVGYWTLRLDQYAWLMVGDTAAGDRVARAGSLEVEDPRLRRGQEDRGGRDEVRRCAADPVRPAQA